MSTEELSEEDPRLALLRVLTAAAAEDKALLIQQIIELPNVVRATVLHMVSTYIIYMWQELGYDPLEKMQEASLWFAEKGFPEQDRD